jgi:NTP pyrophosphatase (non-canonical NTP hydrolase)
MSREFDKYSDVCMNCQSFKDCLVASGEDSVYKAQLAVLAFNNARELWKLKTPKNLAMAISCEAGELLECFLWSISGDQVPSIQDLEDEVADIFILLLDFCSKTGIDLTSALEIKLNKNAIKYPI